MDLRKVGRLAVSARAKVGLGERSLLLVAPLLLLAGFYARLFLPRSLGRMVVRRGDFTEEFFALHAYAYHALSSGHLPLWNPNTYAGYPFLGDIQSAVFYPPHLALDGVLIMAGAAHMPVWALELLLPVHVGLAAVFTYALARTERLARAPSLLAGLGFAFGGYLLSYPQQQVPILETVVWFPAVLVTLARALQAQTSVRRTCWLVAAGWVFGLALLAGHPQTVLYMSYATVGYALSLALGGSGGKGVSRKQNGLGALGALAVLFLIAILLAAVQLVPSLELFQFSTRETMSYAVASHGFRWSDLVSLARPQSYFTRSLYVGPLFLSLAVVAVIARRQQSVLFWLALALTGLLLALGGNGPIYPMLYRIGPGFGLFRDQERVVLLTSLAFAMLAGHGLDVLREVGAPLYREVAAGRRASRAVWISIGMIGMWAIFFLAVRWSAPAEGARPALALSTLGMLPLMALATRRLSWPVGSVAIIALAAISLIRLSWVGNFVPSPQVVVYPSTPIIRFLQEKAGIARVTTDGLWPADHGYVDGLAEIGGMSEMRLRSYDHLRHRLSRIRFLHLAGVRYLVSWQSDLARQSRWHGQLRLLVTERYSPFTGAPLYLYEIENVPSLATPLARIRTVASSVDALRVMNGNGFNPRTDAVAISAVPSATTWRPCSAASVTIRSWRAGAIVLDVTSQGQSSVVVRQMDYPGWRAQVDGAPLPINRFDVGFQGVNVDRGRHTLLLLYDPLSVKIGIAISAIAVAGSLLLLAWLARATAVAPVPPPLDSEANSTLR